MRGDARDDQGVPVPVDDQMAGGHDRELARARQAEPRSPRLRPRPPMSVANRLERLVTERDAHEGWLAVPCGGHGARDDARQLLAERRIVEPGDETVSADGERRDVQSTRGRATAIDPDRERLVGQRAVQLRERGARGTSTRDRVRHHIAWRGGAKPHERVAVGLRIAGEVHRVACGGLGKRHAAGKQPPPGVDRGHRGKLAVDLGRSPEPRPHVRVASGSS